ncbi:metallophosphoesterase family protein [Rhizobium rhizogenes]|uniref:metallophosphoesterase family protein n=1 Tax=Rhizobium rhizogenes TaxID=359 RepID=UPI0015737A65|nr:metallophosphoesterase [Rhizobium rhizogenes]NTI33395.1 metallophosphoesterase [Rhizobium rhizogenes]WEO65094.1 metallophosphoesterase [Rhizobium rhizogenes]
MGARFDVNHINLVGYLTDETGAQVPRTDRETLGTFLMSLCYNGSLISSTQGTPDDWTDHVAGAAKEQFNRLNFQFGAEENVEQINVRPFLAPLKAYFTGYDFYALVLPQDNNEVDKRSLHFFMEAGISSGANGLVLLPYQSFGAGLTQFVDPFPAVRQLALQPVSPPAVVFWTRLGGACVLPLSEALAFLRHHLLDALRGGLRSTDAVIAAEANRQRTKRILHLSDLHIGREEATMRRSYLKRHLNGVLSNIDRVVITGDLFDTPSELLRSSFDEFRHDIEDRTKKPLLVIPGNHDVRVNGNAFGRFGRNAEFVTDLEWSPFHVDHELETVFFSFNSNEGGDFATGYVGNRQRLNCAERHDDAVQRDDRIKNYFKIALVHHHPVKYGSHPTALYERILAKFGGDERFIAFNESDDFLKWCIGRGVGLVLHGHKHIPHLTSVAMDNDAGHEITVVGCGSSAGIDGRPMCYDIINLDPSSGKWSVSFHHDERGDGSGFKLQNVAVDLRSSS